MEQRLSIVTIAVDDLDTMARFYEAMSYRRHQGITDQVAFFQLGGVILGLFERKEAEKDSGIRFGDGVPRIYLAYNTRSDAEVDEVLAAVAKAGGKIIKPAGKAFWGGWYGYFADPEGNLWEVAHNPDFPMDADGNISLPPE
ncbi:MAG TPA: VOC family protein [Rhizobiaceae bacterium]|nr:VOC family protein [Rhizobiaceae bacterium]